MPALGDDAAEDGVEKYRADRREIIPGTAAARSGSAGTFSVAASTSLAQAVPTGPEMTRRSFPRGRQAAMEPAATRNTMAISTFHTVCVPRRSWIALEQMPIPR